MKDRKTYKTLTLLGLLWILPTNRMYIGRRWVLRLLTLNYFYFGALADVFYMDRTFDEAMARRGYLDISRRG